jgi:hypothetical protein
MNLESPVNCNICNYTPQTLFLTSSVFGDVVGISEVGARKKFDCIGNRIFQPRYQPLCGWFLFELIDVAANAA